VRTVQPHTPRYAQIEAEPVGRVGDEVQRQAAAARVDGDAVERSLDQRYGVDGVIVGTSVGWAVGGQGVANGFDEPIGESSGETYAPPSTRESRPFVPQASEAPREPEVRSFDFDRPASPPPPPREAPMPPTREAPPPATASEPREWTPTPPTDTTTARDEP